MVSATQLPHTQNNDELNYNLHNLLIFYIIRSTNAHSTYTII